MLSARLSTSRSGHERARHPRAHHDRRGRPRGHHARRHHTRGQRGPSHPRSASNHDTPRRASTVARIRRLRCCNPTLQSDILNRPIHQNTSPSVSPWRVMRLMLLLLPSSPVALPATSASSSLAPFVGDLHRSLYDITNHKNHTHPLAVPTKSRIFSDLWYGFWLSFHMLLHYTMIFG
jgi:hypothetical protein